MNPVRLITVAPGHFHAALVQKEMYEGVESHAHVYGPLGPDLLAHLGRIAAFNSRPHAPTDWRLEVHAGPGWRERAFGERPGNVAVFSGRNRGKIDLIRAAVEAGLNVLADKPWVIVPEDLPKLDSALRTADERRLVAYDVMTERFEITSALQRELVHDPDTFGDPVPGTAAEPGVSLESVHYLCKTVAGAPNRRPTWFFDVHEQGEGLADVGTHLVDLVFWTLFPGQGIDHGADVRVLAAGRWPTILGRADFERVTGEADFPAALAPAVRSGRLEYFCNTSVSYTVRGVHVRLDVRWDYEAAAGAGDTHLAAYRGSRSRVEVRQGPEEGYRPELYVVPNTGGLKREVEAALRAKVEALQARWRGVEVADGRDRLRLTIPDRYRVGHEAHFAEVMRRFLGYLREPGTLPAWERPNLLAKYHVTTRGVELARSAA